jgi:hypothetical protein
MKKLIFAFIIIAFTSSCKEEEATPLSKTELLSSKPWKWTEGSVSPGYDFFGDGKLINGEYRSKMPVCFQDDIRTFTAAGQYTNDEGATKCDPADPQIYSESKWVFGAGETTIKFTDLDYEWTIVSLSETTLKVTEVYMEGTTKYTFSYTFGH